MHPHGEFLGRNLSRLFCCNMKQSWGAAEPSGVRVSVACQTPAQELSVQCVGGQRPVSGSGGGGGSFIFSFIFLIQL